MDLPLPHVRPLYHPNGIIVATANRFLFFNQTGNMPQTNTMKTFLNFCTGIALTASLLVATTGCDRFDNQIQPEAAPSGAARLGDFDLSNGGFDAALFAQKIEAQLANKVPGFGYRMWVNGSEYAVGVGGGGKARYAIDAPALNYTAQTRQDIASSTKFVTALTVLRILERNGKNTSELVWPYLPAYFKAHPDFKKLRFIDVLSHTSGIVQYTSPNVQKGQLNAIQLAVEKGIELNEYTTNTWDYENMNYGVLRLTVPYLYANLENSSMKISLKALETDYATLNSTVASVFINAVRNEVMQPAGIAAWSQVDFQDWGSAANQVTKYYLNNITSQPGVSNGSNVLDPGAGGLVISADELAQVVAKARAGKIVSANTYQQMKAGKIGMYQLGFDNNIIGKYGSYYHKNGTTANVSTVVMDFQGKSNHESDVNVQLVVMANMGNSQAGTPSVWATLFDQSWK